MSFVFELDHFHSALFAPPPPGLMPFSQMWRSPSAPEMHFLFLDLQLLKAELELFGDGARKAAVLPCERGVRCPEHTLVCFYTISRDNWNSVFVLCPQSWLRMYGYLPQASRQMSTMRSAQILSGAVSDMQRFYGLQVTGTMDPETIRLALRLSRRDQQKWRRPSSFWAFVLNRPLFPSPQCHEETPLWRPRQVWGTNQNQRATETLRPHWTQMEQETTHLQVMTGNCSSSF